MKTALITGATSGIGRATARVLAKNNYKIVLCGRREDRISELQKELSEFIAQKYKDTSRLSQRIDINLSYLKKYCEQNKLEQEAAIVSGLEKISQNMYQKLLQMTFDSVEDIEILKVKLDSLRLLARSGRYGLTHCDYLVENLGNDSQERSLSYLINWRISENSARILGGIDQVLKIVDRF